MEKRSGQDYEKTYSCALRPQLHKRELDVAATVGEESKAEYQCTPTCTCSYPVLIYMQSVVVCVLWIKPGPQPDSTLLMLL